jgi:hypothetical protein
MPKEKNVFDNRGGEKIIENNFMKNKEKHTKNLTETPVMLKQNMTLVYTCLNYNNQS